MSGSPRVARPTLIELAVRVLRAAVERAHDRQIDAVDVRLALRCLWPHVERRDLLVEFWVYAGQLHNANRAESCTAILASIVNDLRGGGRFPDADHEARRLLVEALQDVERERDRKRDVHRRHYFAPPRRRT